MPLDDDDFIPEPDVEAAVDAAFNDDLFSEQPNQNGDIIPRGVLQTAYEDYVSRGRDPIRFPGPFDTVPIRREPVHFAEGTFRMRRDVLDPPPNGQYLVGSQVFQDGTPIGLVQRAYAYEVDVVVPPGTMTRFGPDGPMILPGEPYSLQEAPPREVRLYPAQAAALGNLHMGPISMGTSVEPFTTMEPQGFTGLLEDIPTPEEEEDEDLPGGPPPEVLGASTQELQILQVQALEAIEALTRHTLEGEEQYGRALLWTNYMRDLIEELARRRDQVPTEDEVDAIVTEVEGDRPVERTLYDFLDDDE